MNKSPVATLRYYLANSPDTQALSEGDSLGTPAERRKRFVALQLTIPGLITGAELQRKIASHLGRPPGAEGNTNCQHSSATDLTDHVPA
jgi:hypothetical protein